MADPTQAQNSDALSPEDVQALVHAQQQLYAAGDPRAARLYNYIVQSGYATKGQNGALVPPVDLSNRQGQGVYQMGKDGQTSAIPYGQVQAAAQQGYQFASDDDKLRYIKDNSADPNRRTVFSPAAGDPRGSVAYQQQMEDSAPAAMQLVGGVAKGAATLAKPLLDAADYAATGRTDSADQMTQARTGLQKAAKYATIAASTVPATIAAPVTTMAGAGAGMLGAGAGQLIGNATHLSPGATTLLSDALGLAGGVAGAEGSTAARPMLGDVAERFFPSFFAKSPEGLLTRAAKPYKNNINWNTDAATAIPLMKSAEQSIGKPIEGIDDAIQAAAAAKQNVWQQYKAYTSGASQMGATIDGNKIADAMINSIGPRMRQQNPGLVEQITQQAATYRRPMTVDEAEQYLSGKDGVNNELASYYKKNNADRRAAEADPEISYKVAEGDALRDALYSKLDDVNGPGAAQLKQAYGSLSNVQRELLGRKIVWERQNPISLGDQFSTARGAAKIAKGMVPYFGDVGDIVEGAQNIAVARLGHKLNDPNVMIARAFQNAQPAQPFPMSTPIPIRGMLPRGPIQMGPGAEGPYTPNNPPPPIDATTRAQRLGLLLPEKSGAPTLLPYYPELSGGERLAALLHYLRNNPAPLSLPAKVPPIQLPPSF